MELETLDDLDSVLASFDVSEGSLDNYCEGEVDGDSPELLQLCSPSASDPLPMNSPPSTAPLDLDLFTSSPFSLDDFPPSVPPPALFLPPCHEPAPLYSTEGKKKSGKKVESAKSVEELVRKTKIFNHSESQSKNKERKSIREKQRRIAVNRKFEALAKCLQQNAKTEKALLIQSAIETIQLLRAENQALKNKFCDSQSTQSNEVQKPSTAKSVVEEPARKKRKSGHKPIMPSFATKPAPQQYRLPKIAPAKSPVSSSSSFSSLSCGSLNSFSASKLAQIDLSKVPGLEKIFQGDAVLPPQALLASLLQNQLTQARSKNRRHADSDLTHSHCA